MTKKGTPTASEAIRQALAEGLQTPEAIQVSLRKLGLDMDTGAISYHKGRIQAEEKKPNPDAAPTAREKPVESAAVVVPPENGRERKVATKPEPAPARPKAPRAAHPEKPARVKVQVSAPRVEPPAKKSAAEKPRTRPKAERKTLAPKATAAEQVGPLPSLEDLFAVKALVKEKGGSLNRLAQQVAEVEELAGRIGGLARLKRCLEVLRQLAGD